MNDLLPSGCPISTPASAIPRQEEISRSVTDQARTDRSTGHEEDALDDDDDDEDEYLEDGETAEDDDLAGVRDRFVEHRFAAFASAGKQSFDKLTPMLLLLLLLFNDLSNIDDCLC